MISSRPAQRIAVAMTRSGILVYASPYVVEKIGGMVQVRFDKDDGGKVAVHLTSPSAVGEGSKFGKTDAGPDHTTWANKAAGKRLLGSHYFGKTECEVIALDAGNAIALLPPARSTPRNRKMKGEVEAKVLNAPAPKANGAAVDLDAMLELAKKHGMAYDVARNRFVPLKTNGDNH